MRCSSSIITRGIYRSAIRQISTSERRPRRVCMFAVDFPKSQRVFQYLPTVDKGKWMSKLGEPVVAAFVPAEFERKLKPRPPQTPHVPCSECVAEIADGRFAQDGGATWASARCVNELCGRC